MKVTTTQRSQSRNRGFSLFETLMVIAIVAILMGMASIQFRPPRPVQAARMASGTLMAARAEAITEGKRSRVAICIDPGSDGLYLRQLVSLVDSDTDTKTNEWIIKSIDSFPPGTCFWDLYSSTKTEIKLDTKPPLAVQDGLTGDAYTYIEFDALGQCENSHQWIFTQAIFDSALPTIPNRMDRDGFILRKTGKLTFFRSPEQINQPSPAL